MTLRLDAKLMMGMIEHALELHPIEACGMLVGRKGGRPVEHWPMVNVLASTTRFAFNPDEQLQKWAQLDQLGWDPLVIYHSHTASSTVPSRYDVAHSFEPGAHFVIVSTAEEEPAVSAYRRVGAALAEVPIVVTD